MPTKPDTKPDDTSGDGDPWESFTPDQMMDGVAERLWTRMGAKPDGGDGDPGDGDPGDGDTGDGGSGERPPKATSRGQKWSDWFFGGSR